MQKAVPLHQPHQPAGRESSHPFFIRRALEASLSSPPALIQPFNDSTIQRFPQPITLDPAVEPRMDANERQ
jgi:hypothetical protein